MHNEKGQQVDESNNTGLYRKILFKTNGPFCAWKWHILITHFFLLFDWARLKLSQVTVIIGSLNSQEMITFMITAGALNIQDMIRFLKQSRHMISRVSIYVMDMVWVLCVVYVWRSKLMVLQSFFKNLLCKLVWMLSLNVENW